MVRTPVNVPVPVPVPVPEKANREAPTARPQWRTRAAARRPTNLREAEKEEDRARERHAYGRGVLARRGLGFERGEAFFGGGQAVGLYGALVHLDGLGRFADLFVDLAQAEEHFRLLEHALVQ